MKREATKAGFYDLPGLLPRVARLRILTVEELLAGKKLDYPRVQVETFHPLTDNKPVAGPFWPGEG